MFSFKSFLGINYFLVVYNSNIKVCFMRFTHKAHFSYSIFQNTLITLLMSLSYQKSDTFIIYIYQIDKYKNQKLW